MDRMNGLDLHLAMRRTNGDIPVTFVTATNDRAARERALSQGAMAFLVKPVTTALYSWRSVLLCMVVLERTLTNVSRNQPSVY